VKIALVNSSLCNGRGSDLVVRDLAQRLSLRHDVTIFAVFGADLDAPGCHVVAPACRRSSLWSRLRALWSLSRRLRRDSDAFDIVNCHHSLLALALPKRRLLVTYHGYRGRLHFGLGRRVAGAISWFVRRWLVRPSLRRARSVSVVSHSLLQEAIAARPALPPRVIYNGVDFSARESAADRCGEYFLYVGRIDADKSVGDLLALYLSADCQVPLYIAGDGAQKKELAQKYGDERIRFLGPQPRTALPQLYRDAVAFITASSYETFCLPVIEAAAFGKPSLGPQKGALPEVIDHGQTGFLYRSDEEFRRYLKALAALPEAARLAMAAACRARAGAYSWACKAEEYEDFYADTLKAHAPLRRSRRPRPEESKRCH